MKTPIKEVVTAFILTKNSEKTIERTLRSIRPFVGSIIILDTGSTDKTIQCCLPFGCSIWYDSWKDDFSYTRNLALKYCSTPWILMIDSDEELLELDNEQFLNVVNNQKVGGISVSIKNFLNETNTSYSTHSYTRLFRNSPKIQFKGTIHEQINQSIVDAGLEIVPSTTEIGHYGYKENDQHKRERNEILLEKELEKTDDVYIEYQLLLTHFANQKFNKVIQKGKFLIHSVGLSYKQRELIRLRVAQSYLHFSQFPFMESILNERMVDTEYEFFRKYLNVILLLQLRNFEKAQLEILFLINNFNSGMVTIEELMKIEKLIESQFSKQ